MVITLKNNLAVTHPDLAKEYMAPPKNELPADRVLARTNKKLWWKCRDPECAYEWRATGASRVGGLGCPACAGKIRISEKPLRKSSECGYEY